MSHHEPAHHGPGYASPAEARSQPREQVAYVACLYEGTGINEP
ncbi:MAG: selenium-binding family protein, partial [Actinomycetota bacterium]|nr:selenium-binding family protein [Actinomycetota bacterium]